MTHATTKATWKNVMKSPRAYGTFPVPAQPPQGPDNSVHDTPCSHSAQAQVQAQRASVFSRVFLLGFGYLVDISKARTIQIQDVWQQDDADRSATAYDQYKTHLKTPRDFTTTTWTLYWRWILWSGSLSLIGAIADVLNPVLMYVLIAAVTNRETSVNFIIAVLVARHAIKIVSQVAKQHSNVTNSIVAMRAIGALHSMVFDATISATWSPHVTVSQASNVFYELGSVHQMLRAIHSLWITPLSIATNLFVLYSILGDAMVGSIIAAAVFQLVAFVLERLNKHFAGQLHRHRGRRLQILSECFKTIQSIKLFAWENRFLEKIERQRKKERAVFTVMAAIDAVWRAVLVVLPEVVLAGALAVMASTENNSKNARFNPAVVFASLSILNRTRVHVGHLIWLLNVIAMARVALTHAFTFLESSRPQRDHLEDTTGEDHYDSALGETDLSGTASASRYRQHHQYAVRIWNATIARTAQEPQLVMVSLLVPKGSLTVIHGTTGAGKSTLLHAMVDNTLLVNAPRGSIHVQGRIAYCSQDPWLQTLSIRDNILFGLPYDEHKYLNVLHTCCLIRDMAALRYGDATVIGPKGLTLSGGQKARIALARACYADADVYLLDSPLASVDAIVQSDIFRRCIIDLLKHKTIVLVTQNVEIVTSPFVDQVVLVHDYRLLVERESPQRRQRYEQSNRCSLAAPTKSMSVSSSTTKYVPPRSLQFDSPVDGQSMPCGLNLLTTQSTRLEQEWHRIQAKGNGEMMHKTSLRDENNGAGARLVQSAFNYVEQCGGITGFAFPLGVLCALSCAALTAGHIWICTWNDSREGSDDDIGNIKVFITLLGVSSLLALLASVLTLTRTGVAADALFNRMVRGVLMAPMAFYYKQPIGEVMNRFSVDVRTLDETMDGIVLDTVATLLRVVASWLVLIYIMPEMLCVLPAVVWFLCCKNRHQMETALAINRLVLSSHSPCFDAISEAIHGRHTIQAFGPLQVARFQRDHHGNLDQLLHMQHVATVMQGWSLLQFFKIDSLLLVVVIVSVFLRRDALGPLFGLALHYVVTPTTNMFSLQLILVQAGSATIRIQNAEEYGAIAPEQLDDSVLPSFAALPHDWPSNGDIVFDNVSFQYDDLSGPVLQHIQLHIAPGEKIGLVGRTGAGKSSLTMALFRIHELVAGRILIDGVDIALADVYSVRSRLSIIPQSPLFFQGTLRSYLDPFDELDDVALWESLRKTGLATVVTRMDGKLLAQLQENAENLSLGERQLLCLSRVMLKRSRVVVLDEATAAIDHESDEALQRVLKSEFQQATVISIAHRLDSIMAFDRVVVMEDGRIVQCGTVEELVGEANGPFFDLLEGALLKM